MRFEYAPYTLDFITPSGTSRGVMTRKLTCLVRIFDESDPSRFGIGEAGVFEGLSPEAGAGYELKLLELVANVAIGRPTDLSRHPSIMFGFEQAIRDFTGGCRGLYFPSPFTEGQSEIEINGLVWMGTAEEMRGRIREKVAQGFRCIKLKIGAIDWESEIGMVRMIREEYPGDELTIRVDANGGFPVDGALERLRQLADLGVHSIEQPLPAGMVAETAALCRVSPLPIALDEELIGKFTTEDKVRMLDDIRPAFIILKPSLCGGFSGAEEWISLASERGIGWWVTSALESNVGLNALAQWTATLGTTIPQGLGTGALFTNNFTAPLRLDGDRLRFDPSRPLDYRQFDNLDWRG